MNRNRLFWTGIGLAAFALVLVSRPSCGRGCRTMAEHLAEHGVTDLIASFFA